MMLFNPDTRVANASKEVKEIKVGKGFRLHSVVCLTTGP
jgi:hypothetical protein